MGTQTVTTETEFNVLQFEKRLTTLKDSQDSINTCCQWCLQNRQHHKKIVTAWLNVLKRVKVEQRLILFYLANDVVQYAKKRNYEFVDSWGTAIQKATTLVRDEKVKHKILRIFKIWEQRGVYNEELISDLCGLINVVPSAPKGDEPHEFQPTYVINKIKTCAKLEGDTDSKLKQLKEHHPKAQVSPEFFTTLKDRAQLDDVEKDIEVHVKHTEDYINALKLEIKSRIDLISVLKQAEGQLESDRKDVKLVAHAYKTFGTRVKTFQKKLKEHIATLSSPIPSPDIDAPSPSPDSDIDLPDEETKPEKPTTSIDFNAPIQFTNPGYYNPVPPPTSEAVQTSNSFLSNGFSSFLGSSMPFDISNLNSVFSTANSSSDTLTANSVPPVPSYVPPVPGQPPLPVEAPVIPPQDSFYPTGSHVPLLPPPMPPFTSKNNSSYINAPYNPANNAYNNTITTAPYVPSFNADSSFSNANSTFNSSLFSESSFQESFDQSGQFPPDGAAPEEYNPEQEIETWEGDQSWQKDTDTPESPPTFEKESHVEPIEYHDNVQTGALDVDHRVLPLLSGADVDDSLSSNGTKDVDHRNLISLTGSPAIENNSNSQSDVWSQSGTNDQDYRLPFTIPNLKLPPPPPPPATVTFQDHGLILKEKPTRKFQDNVECTDMDLSDDEALNAKISPEGSFETFSLEPPPPLPDLPDDVDANNFLDEFSNDLNEFGNLEEQWEQPSIPPAMPPPNLPLLRGPPQLMGIPQHNWNDDGNQNWISPDHWQNNGQNQNFNNNYRGRSPMRSPYRGRGRGGFRGNGNYRGRNPRGSPHHRPRGNFRGGFRTSY